jgi:mRNA interferase RelE/StbE
VQGGDLDLLGGAPGTAGLIISESLAALGRGEPGADLAAVRQDLPRRRITGCPAGGVVRHRLPDRCAAGHPRSRPPESVAAAVLEFCAAALAVSPQRAGTPLFGPLAGCHGARRGTHIGLWTASTKLPVYVRGIDHRDGIYHQPKA